MIIIVLSNKAIEHLWSAAKSHYRKQLLLADKEFDYE